MRGYFIQATKEMLKGEGLKSISVRSIADRAGYSFGTIYNYFKDINELVFLCVQDFEDECEEYIKSETDNKKGLEKIKAIAKAYLGYFVQYPGIFELFYIERITETGKKPSTSELICTFIDKLCTEEWDKCIAQETITKEDAKLIQNGIKYLLPGLLLLYINRRHPTSYNEFKTIANAQLNLIFNKISNKQ